VPTEAVLLKQSFPIDVATMIHPRSVLAEEPVPPLHAMATTDLRSFLEYEAVPGKVGRTRETRGPTTDDDEVVHTTTIEMENILAE